MSPHTDTRAQIMDAFAEQLAATGYQGISLAQVGRTVGIQKPSIYHHFPGGKEDLYIAVAERYIRDVGGRLAAALVDHRDVEERLGTLAAVVAGQKGESITFEQRIYDALHLVSDETRDHVRACYVNLVLDPVTAFFTSARDQGVVAGEPAFLMNAFLHLARAADLTDDTGPTRIVALFLDGARPR
ncbi:TetR/AcrR family transcriptional regulator [Micromonospora fiedleri]|uniref:TetR/AcrR family transcriptional regulator n=1 Tax=Micromonospora fiedleri TaxID=1157498 RepID=A0ABS1UJW2_9ACTN|nr:MULTISPECIES: TetR/AcrR family transcriptional regulator [Micromonospora]MBL6276642.1 TetR/AcrR family transcriptional regulator [Micromonospora fiedleri]WSK40195.1 TetR/AcrR family transcriptional regulator [Micromonospora maris]